jgi:hypothetical protein
MATRERWRAVVGHEGAYEVSDQGQVRSLDRIVVLNDGRTRFAAGRVLRAGLTGYGYLHVGLGLEGRRLNRKIHQLVMQAFVGPCPEGMEVCHGPGGKTDNRLINLSYGTKSQNQVDRLRDGTDARGRKNANARLTEEEVILIRASSESVTALAARLGVARTTVSSVRNRQNWSWLPQ